MGKRDAAILDILNAEKKVEVASLAERLGVSAVTMRKDLDALAADGVVQREHGYALLGNPDDVGGRLARHYEEKLAIAERAAELVSDGDTVIIENGSCCALLARAIAGARREVTIVTNSVFIADYVRDFPAVNVVLLGGVYQLDSQVTVGPMVRSNVRDFYVRRMFIGADGWAGGTNFTNADHLRAEAVRDMAEQAEEVVVLTESEKFAHRGVVPLHVDDKIKTIVSDGDIPADVRHELEARGVEILLARK